MRLIGKTCFVTAAAQGIGRSIVDRFVDEGAQVIAADLRYVDSAVRPQETRVILDVTNEAAVSATVAEYADVDVLVNCVGYVANGTLLECALEDFDRSVSINVRSMVLMSRAFLPNMLARRSGSIINIASVVSSVTGAPNRFAYGTTKAAVIGLTKSIARDYVTQGIRCNAISPGTIETPSLHERWAATGDVDAARKAFVARQPMGRLGHPAEVAAVAAMLASDESAFMTGTNTIIDGGWTL
jgi:2-keto-3-deoxy-L-fuconate dehydrogenase